MSRKSIASPGSIIVDNKGNAPVPSGIRAMNFHGSHSNRRSAEVLEAKVSLTRAFMVQVALALDPILATQLTLRLLGSSPFSEDLIVSAYFTIAARLCSAVGRT
jgi:hypothetical protein